MKQYKYIHKDNGYKSLYSTNDRDLWFNIDNDINTLRSICSKPRENVYAYINDNKYSIYYKESNTIINSLFDDQNELEIKFPNAYPSEILFNESLIVIDNVDEELKDKDIKPLSFVLPNFIPNEIKFVPVVVNALLLNQRIAIIGRNAENIKNFIRFVLYLFPPSYAKNIGFIVNLASMPNIFDPMFNSVKIYGLTDQYQNFDDVDLVVNLTMEYDNSIHLNEYAKLLCFNLNTLQMHRKSKELFGFFDGKNYDNDRAYLALTPQIFSLEKNFENANNYIDVLHSSSKNINIHLFRELVEYIVENDMYKGELANKIDNIINSNSNLSEYKIVFKERLITNYLSDISKLNDEEINEIVLFYADEKTSLKTNNVNRIIEQRKNAKAHQIVIGIISNVSDESKKSFIWRFYDIDETFDIRINSKLFSNYVIEQLFLLEKDKLIDCASRFLYSTILIQNKEKDVSKTRRKGFITKLIEKYGKEESLEIVFNLYKFIYELLQINLVDDIVDYVEFELFSDEELDLLTKMNNRNPQDDYLKLLNYMANNDSNSYHRLQNKIASLLLGKDKNDNEYYKKYVTVYNVEQFVKFFDNTNLNMSDEISNYIDSLEEEANVSSKFENYRLDFIYNYYFICNNTTKERIAKSKKVNLITTKNIDENIKSIIYGTNNPKLQKDTIDTIIDFSKSKDDVSISVVNNKFSKKIFLMLFMALIFSLFGYVIINIPFLLKVLLIKNDLYKMFYELNNIYIPITLLYTYIVFLGSYFFSIKKTRGNFFQALSRTMLYTFLLVYVPYLSYVLGYLTIYFIL